MTDAYILHRRTPHGHDWTLGVWEDLGECQAYADRLVGPPTPWEHAYYDGDHWSSQDREDGHSFHIELVAYIKRGE